MAENERELWRKIDCGNPSSGVDKKEWPAGKEFISPHIESHVVVEEYRKYSLHV